MATMRVILSEDVPSLGAVGQIVNVKGGFGRNYLIPRGKAILANERNKKQLDFRIAQLEKKKKEILAGAKKLADAIQKIAITITKQVGEEEKIFGSVTTAELEHALRAEGIEIDRKQISLDQDIKKVGVYSATAKIHTEISAKFKVWVVAQ